MKKVLILVGLFLLAGPLFAIPVDYNIVVERLPGNEEYSATEANKKSTGTVTNVLVGTTTATVVLSTDTLSGWRIGPVMLQNQSADNYYCSYDVNVSTYVISGSENLRGTLLKAGKEMTKSWTKEITYYCKSAGTTPTRINIDRTAWRR